MYVRDILIIFSRKSVRWVEKRAEKLKSQVHIDVCVIMLRTSTIVSHYQMMRRLSTVSLRSQYGLWINGAEVGATGGATLEVVHPLNPRPCYQPQ